MAFTYNALWFVCECLCLYASVLVVWRTMCKPGFEETDSGSCLVMIFIFWFPDFYHLKNVFMKLWRLL